jgi:cell wall-associated NlpC family hydrolase
MRKLVFSLIATACLNLISCGKHNDEPATPIEEVAEGASDFIDELPSATGFNTSSVILPNGLSVEAYLSEVDPTYLKKYGFTGSPRTAGTRGTTGTGTDIYKDLGPQDARNALIAQVTATALNLTDDSKHQPVNPITGDKQNGLAYSYGSKDPTLFQAPPSPLSKCGAKIYGVDCSGFVEAAFKSAGVNLTGNALEQSQKGNILTSIQAAIPAFEKAKVDDKGQLPKSEFLTGDIIYWDVLPKPDKQGHIIGADKDATHIGIVVLQRNGTLGVAQSNGRIGTDADECTGNQKANRGPRIVPLDNIYFFNSQFSHYKILRINADLAGKWRYNMRCDFATADVLQLVLDFPKTTDNKIHIVTTATDYDGSRLDCTFDFTYNEPAKMLEGTASITDDGKDLRVDTFSFPLLRDNAGYVSTTRQVVNNGCAVKVSLTSLK